MKFEVYISFRLECIGKKLLTYFLSSIYINQEIKLQINGTVFVASDNDNLLLPALPWFLDFNRKTIKDKKEIVILRLASRLPIILLRRIVLLDDNIVTISFINLDQFLGTIAIVWYHFIVMRFVHFCPVLMCKHFVCMLLLFEGKYCK